jgi:hypothetical protein
MFKKSLAAMGFLALLAGLAFAQEDSAPKGSNCGYCQRANGAWASELMTVRIDFDKGAYTGIAMYQPFNNPLKLLEETPDFLTIEVTAPDGPYKATVQFTPEGGLVLTAKESPWPLVLQPKTD